LKSMEEFKKLEGYNLNLWPVKVGKVSSNYDWLLIYLPRAAIEVLKLKKGTRILMLIDKRNMSLIIKPLHTFKEAERNE